MADTVNRTVEILADVEPPVIKLTGDPEITVSAVDARIALENSMIYWIDP